MRNKLGPFLGVTNRVPHDELTTRIERAHFDLLAAAVNVDRHSSGRIKRRAGYTKSDGASFRGLWGDGGNLGYALCGDSIVAVDPDGFIKPVVTATPRMDPVFARRADVVFWTNGLRMGAIVGDTPVQLTPALPVEPYAEVVPNGGLSAGSYMLCFSLSGPLGEGPTTAPISLDVPDYGAIQIAGIHEPEGLVMNVYITAPNGTVFNAIEPERFSDRGLITVLDDSGQEAETVGLVSLPVGSVIASSGSRLLVAKDNTVFYSEPFAPLVMQPHNFLSFDAPVRMMCGCDGGVYIATSRATYWFGGELSTAEMSEVLPYGAVSHSTSASPSVPGTVYWVSPRGLIRGQAQGKVRAIQEERLSLAGGKSAAVLVRESDGQVHVLAAVQAPHASRGAIHASIGAEIKRKGS